MRQVIVKRGQIISADVPAPTVENGRLLVDVAYSLISPGTEINKVEATGRPLIIRAFEQPEKIKQVVQLIRLKGIHKTFAKITEQVNLSSPVGYSCAGRVIGIGAGVQGIGLGDLVACAGAGMANHAEIVSVPHNLVVRVPEGCSLREAASVTLGAIAVQGVRRTAPQLGEIVAVIGLGILGHITAQLLRITGCQVVAFDMDQRRVRKVKEFGIEHAFVTTAADAVNELLQLTDGHGADATVITAASKSNNIVQQAMRMTRKKGRVVIVGDIGLALERSPFYEKEIDLLISCSYGPGRYDPTYEHRGCDYPYPYVRWTENRNMREYLRLIAGRQLQIEPILEREFEVADAHQAYDELRNGDEKPLGVLLKYSKTDSNHAVRQTKKKIRHTSQPSSAKIRLAIVGAGQFTRGTHLPNLRRLDNQFSIHAIVSGTGNNAKSVAEQFGASYASTNYEDVLDDPDVDAVLIATRHHLHAEQVIAALRAGKHVYCEKPLALHESELDDILSCLGTSASELKYGDSPEEGPILTVGFNRRFAPTTRRVRECLATRATPIMVLYRVNAGYFPADHWTQGPEGGGRIVGEACHMLDLFDYLVGSEPIQANVEYLGSAASHQSQGDNASITVRYSDGSVGSLIYTSLGHTDLPKEYIEVFSEGKNYIIDDFNSLKVHGANISISSGTAEKGHLQAMQYFADCIHDREAWPISLGALMATSRLAIQVADGVCLESDVEIMAE